MGEGEFGKLSPALGVPLAPAGSLGPGAGERRGGELRFGIGLKWKRRKPGACAFYFCISCRLEA